MAEDASLKVSMTNDEFVAVMTYASELFSWYKGSLEADVYFCPERHATYFGGFFMKDYPAKNNPDYFISTSLTGDSGQGFLDVLNSEQRALIEGIIDEQRAALTEIASIRTQVATELRQAMSGGTINKDLVYSLIERYGELDGQISALCALRFAQVNQTLTDSQRSALVALRNLDVVPDGAYLFSTPVPMPEIPNTDYLFGVGAMPDDAGQINAPASFGAQAQQPSNPESATMPDQPGDQKAQNIRVFVNGTDLRFDTPPEMVNGRVLAPVRAIAEALGAEVQWNQDSLTVAISKESTSISLVVGNAVAKVNGQDVTLDSPPQITGGRVLAPVRFIAEAFSLTVAWDNQTRTVTIGSGGALTPAATGTPTSVANSVASGFLLTSPEVTEGGMLPMDYTYDGSSATLPLAWSGEPEGTVSFAVIMHTSPTPTDTHVYWVLYDIPAEIHSLARNVTGVGTLGINSKDSQQAYTPPNSQGPGPKTYTYTVYALSAQPQLPVPATEVTRDILLAAMQGITLASAELNVVCSR